MPKTRDVTDSRYPGVQKAVDWYDWPEGATCVLVEPKFDGFRLSTVVDADGVISFHCGNEAPPDWAEHLEHISAAVRATGVRSAMLDGVATADDWDDMAKMIKCRRSKMPIEMKEWIRRELRYHTFDWVPLDVAIKKRKMPGRKLVPTIPIPLSERYSVLSGLVSRVGRNALRLVPQFKAYSPIQIFTLLDELIDFEFEGAIVKDPNAPYMFARVKCWQKLKPMQTIELTVTEAIAGKDRYKGWLGALVGVLPTGNKVRVGTGFPFEVRSRLWHAWETRPESLIGKVIEVKCPAGDVASVRHGSFLRFRSDDNVSVSDA